MEDAVQAIIIAFSVMVFVVGLTVTMYMFHQTTSTADTLLYYSDKMNFYDNVEIKDDLEKTDRIVDLETVVSTIYRYYKENFCVKIYGVPNGEGKSELIQIFDLDLEADVRKAAATPNVIGEQKALKTMYNDKNKPYYLFEAPWIGSTDEDIKSRIDYYINGQDGYINNTYVDYINNEFWNMKNNNWNFYLNDNEKFYFKENFIRYTYKGDTMTTEDGDVLVNGVQPEDKIIIIYTAQKGY